MRMALLLVYFVGLCFARDHYEIALTDIPARIYHFVELRDGSLLCGFRADQQPYIHAAVRYDAKGQRIAEIVPKGAGETGPQQILMVGQLAEHPSGNIWVADRGQRRLQQFSPLGKQVGSMLLQMPGLLPHGIAFGRSGDRLYLGGCNPKDTGPFQGCKSLVHRRLLTGVAKTTGYLPSDRQKGWNATDKSHYRLNYEWLAVGDVAQREIVAYTNLSARRVWLIDFDQETDTEVSLEAYIPAIPATHKPEEATAAFLGRPLIDHLTSIGPKFYVSVRNQTRAGIGLIEVDGSGQITKTWTNGILPGRLVGKSARGYLVFEYGNRLRFIYPKAIGKVKFE
jgi:hypothetical protein